MLTPKFSCSQNDKSVIISIYVPSVRASELELDVQSTLFTLHVNPYFLRLTFPHSLIEDDDSSALYDPGTGYLTVTLTKENLGQDFGDLGLLGRLIAPEQNVREMTSGIEVLDSDEVKVDGVDRLVNDTRKLTLDEERAIFLEAEKNDWRLPQAIPSNTPQVNLSTSLQKTYGFLDLHSGYFRGASYSQNEANDLGGDAETLPPDGRAKRGEERVEQKWDEDYYLRVPPHYSDYVNDEEIQELIRWRHPFSPPIPLSSLEFTEDEKMAMLRLPRRECTSPFLLPTI
ncbi:hypothetical protein M422DRAFT_187329 [Sphaerobolus stellatus SS14]|uniref:CS domain-containing protein n=1 Tax=Sphaerobolus stellatus (strain SS14) TaxID=990650 RepID=A0A0C9UYT5_SPHS4|nr:hypothetical protein M422DRAFT_187329 [Sphaerobolus stellatus SS14]